MRKTGKKIESLGFIIILIMVAFLCQITAASAVPQVKTDKDGYNYGEAIKVIFFDSPGNPQDWICIVPAGSPVIDAGDYKQMPQGLNQGTLTFNSPSPGKYEVRAYYHYRRNGYVVSTRYSFYVTNGSSMAESEISSGAKQNESMQSTNKSTTTGSLIKVAGQGTRMVGGVMEQIGKENEGTALGSLMTMGGQIYTGVGTSVEKAADNNKGIEGSYKAAMDGGIEAIDNLDNTNNTSKQIIIKAQELLIKRGIYKGKVNGIIGDEMEIPRQTGHRFRSKSATHSA
jgi:hypothetical protein